MIIVIITGRDEFSLDNNQRVVLESKYGTFSIRQQLRDCIEQTWIYACLHINDTRSHLIVTGYRYIYCTKIMLFNKEEYYRIHRRRQ